LQSAAQARLRHLIFEGTATMQQARGNLPQHFPHGKSALKLA